MHIIIFNGNVTCKLFVAVFSSSSHFVFLRKKKHKKIHFFFSLKSINFILIETKIYDRKQNVSDYKFTLSARARNTWFNSFSFYRVPFGPTIHQFWCRYATANMRIGHFEWITWLVSTRRTTNNCEHTNLLWLVIASIPTIDSIIKHIIPFSLHVIALCVRSHCGGGDPINLI